MPQVIQIKNRVLVATSDINKKYHWPDHTKTQEKIDKMIGKDMGTTREKKGSVSAENEQVYMVAHEYSLHTSLMLTNWATTRR